MERNIASLVSLSQAKKPKSKYEDMEMPESMKPQRITYNNK